MRLLEQVYSWFFGSTRDRRLSIPRLILCLGIVAAMIGFVLPSVRSGLAGPRPHSVDPYYSSDAYIQAITGAPKASGRLLEVMAALPKEKPLLIFERDQDSASSLLGMTLAYLSWPKEVRFETVRNNNACDRQLGAVAPDSVAAVAFCDLPAPTWVGGGIRLGRGSRLLPLELTNDRSQ